MDSVLWQLEQFGRLSPQAVKVGLRWEGRGGRGSIIINFISALSILIIIIIIIIALFFIQITLNCFSLASASKLIN